MAYTRHNWQCDETITADLLNNIENGIEDALECCGGGDCGFECVETETVLFNQNVTTTQGAGPYPISGQLPQAITADEITVTFNGIEYVCPKLSSGYMYGANPMSNPVDWSEYPFSIASDGSTFFMVGTETAGTYDIKISALGESINLTDCFIKAVQKAMNTITVTFLNDGTPCGDGNVMQVVTLQKGESISVYPQPLDCSQNSFRGWSTDGSFENLITFPYTPTESITLHSYFVHQPY